MGAPPAEKEETMEENYLSRPLIDGMRYDISGARVMIQCPHTCFVNCSLPGRVDKDTLLRQYGHVLAMAKAQEIKIRYTKHIRRTIRQLWPAYEIACVEREKLFARLTELAQKVKARGIHLGAVDDEVLSTLEGIASQLAVYGYRTSATSQIADIGRTLSELERKLSQERKPYMMIVL